MESGSVGMLVCFLVAWCLSVLFCLLIFLVLVGDVGRGSGGLVGTSAAGASMLCSWHVVLMLKCDVERERLGGEKGGEGGGTACP